MQNHYDIIVIGTGAGGGTLLTRLAPTGKRILVLEGGDFMPRERENWDPRAIAAGRYRADVTYRDADDKPFRPFTHHFVGGNTKLYGAALLRLREHDFGEIRHHGGVSPAWPLGYDVFEPYYSEAEWLYHVRGERGTDPHDPRASRAYRHAAVPHEPRIAALAGALRTQRLRPFPLPLGIRPPAAQQTAVTLSLFDGYPDPTETKADAHVIGVAPALAHPNVELRTGRWVERLTTNASGTAIDGVIARHASEVETYRADLVIVSCGAIESAALFLRSSNAAHPHGLANGHDQVGRHYMTHHNGALLAIADQPNDSAFQKTLALTDFYRQAPDSERPLGAVQMMGRTDADDLAPLIRDLLPNVKPSDAAARCIDFWLTAEDLPVPSNRITLTRERAIQVHYTPNNLVAFDGLKATLTRVLQKALGADTTFTGYRLDISGVSHQCGTLRFGVDPESSVLDLECRAHGIDNLYAVDGSFMPASGAVNPSLTIMANALRVGDQLLARMSKRTG
jgi:choline dehydrogenase-like flavoprotein